MQPAQSPALIATGAIGTPRAAAVAGLAFSLLVVPALDLRFPAWVFVLSVHLLVVAVRRPVDRPAP